VATASQVWSLTQVPGRASSVTAVRRGARAALTGWDAARYEWLLSQLLTEVVTNVVLHAYTTFDVTVHLTGTGVRVEVTDGSPRLPRPRRHSVDATTGRGLDLLEQLSSRWGAVRAPGGKTVWFEIDDPGDDAEGVGLDALPVTLDALPSPTVTGTLGTAGSRSRPALGADQVRPVRREFAGAPA
jgi:anti-sigma regulatory factor (Ser/Thr protein kinase)